MARYIKLYEQILNWEWFNDTVTFKVFVYLLLKANYCDSRFQGIEVKRGQLVTSLQKLATSNRISFQQARTAISHLQSTGEITSQAYHDFRVITVVKYDDYQASTSQATSKQQAINKPANKQATSQATTSIELIENIEHIDIKENSPTESKRKTAQRFSPPTPDEVKTFCQENGLSIDADRFCDYYASRGWKVGSSPMKDWHAAARNWARRDAAPAPVQQKVLHAQNFEQRDYSDVNGDIMRDLAREMAEFKRNGGTV